MEPIQHSSVTTENSREGGQATIFMLLGLGLFLIGGAGFAVDMTNFWMRRQTAQNAADAACTAAAMDMVNYATGGASPSGTGFSPGSDFNCSSNLSVSPCQYASFNGYAATGLTANTPSTEVAITFPATVPGVQTCSATDPPPSVCFDPGFTANPFVTATVTDRMQTFFMGLLSGQRTMDVGATASCGAILSSSPIPILVLNPTEDGTLSMNGSGNAQKITIAGGPQKSIQVNSSSSTAATGSGGPVVDLSMGGPNGNGSDIGVTGGPTSPDFTFNAGTAPGRYISGSPRISDPFATIDAPMQPATAGTTTSVNNSTDASCPAVAGSCVQYTAGYYASGIDVKNKFAVFKPGIYYLDGDFSADSNSCLRPSAEPSSVSADNIGGTMFYIHQGTVNVDANSGRTPTGGSTQGCPTSINTSTAVGTGQLQFGVKCTVDSQVPANLPMTITGNLLMAPCTGDYGDPLGTDDPVGEQHGILFFANRDSDLSGAMNGPKYGGGGTAAALGSLYFHQCSSSSGAEKGSNCSSSAYQDELTFQGTPGSTSYVVGDIITDKLSIGGNASIVMDLNPNALYYVLKASLLK